MKKIIDFLPNIYAPFFPQGFHKHIPEETTANCNNCSMVVNKKSNITCNSNELLGFDENIKCCSYYPKIMNYLIGAILSDQNFANNTARQKIIDIIDKRIEVTPLGIFPSKKYDLLYNSSASAFGKNSTLLCPFYNKEHGNCILWKYRSATCSTWFCKYLKGEDGFEFWREVEKFLLFTEKVLSTYALTEQNWEIDKIMFPFSLKIEKSITISLSSNELDENVPDVEYDAIWGKWKGKEDVFYINCYNIIKQLSRAKFTKITGYLQQLQLSKIISFRDKMINLKLPERLIKNPKLNISRLNNEKYLIIIPNSLHVFELNADTYKAIEEFTGFSANKEVLKIISEKFNYKIEKDLLKSLYHYRILMEA